MTERKPLLYISGKYSDGIIIKNIAAAEKVAVELMRKGFDVICPHKNTSGYEQYEDIPYEQFIEMDLNILERCDGIYMMSRWRESNGAKLELKHAKEIGMITVYENGCTNDNFTVEMFRGWMDE